MDKQFPTLWRCYISLALLVGTLLSMPVGYGLAQGTRVIIHPPSSEVAVGATTTVNIRVENVTDLFGAQAHLSFNPALVEVVDADPSKDGVQIQPGTFLNPYFTALNIADQADGKIHFAISQGPDDAPVSGSGVLATVTFRGKAAGTSAISFDNVILAAPGGIPISADTQGGNVTVPGGEPPTPTATPTPGPTPTPTSTPTPGPTPSVTPTPPWGILGYHTVKPKETLYCIGRAYGVDPYAIARQNGILNPNNIPVGQVLAIPNAPRTLPPGRVCPRQFDGVTPPPACRWHHTVAPGENLYRISLRYGVSMWAIAEANHIFNLHYIRAGQVLCIP
jgi:LysM repeat protein